MFILRKIKNILLTRNIPLLNRHRHTNSSKPNFAYYFLTFFGLGTLYYMFIVPKWLDQRKLLTNSNFETSSPIWNNISGKSYNFVNGVVKRCAPGVFHILITNKKPNGINEISPFVYGSGFVIREDGWAITNAHVVLNKDSYISCKMPNGKIYTAEVVDIDVNVDVALLKLHTDDEELTALPLEKPCNVNVGEWVIALGSPLSLSNSISVGVVSSVNRSARELGLKNYSMSYIQTDALITFGNSGGPLVNLDGNVIGISSLRLTSGISFAIPIEYCLKFLENCKKFDTEYRNDSGKNIENQMTFFGLTTISLNSDLLIDLVRKNLISLPTNVYDGLLIWKIIDGSVAQNFGLDVGDIITHIDGMPVKYSREIYKGTRNEFVEFVVLKKTTQEEISIKIPTNTLISEQI